MPAIIPSKYPIICRASDKEDDWAGVDTELWDDDDGWGSSPPNKGEQTSNTANSSKKLSSHAMRQPDSRSSNEAQYRGTAYDAVPDPFRSSKVPDGSPGGHESSSSGFRSNSGSRSPESQDRGEGQREKKSRNGKGWHVVPEEDCNESKAYGVEQEAQAPFEGNFNSARQEFTDNQAGRGHLEAEVLEDAEPVWDDSIEDWQEGQGPDITLLSPTEAVNCIAINYQLSVSSSFLLMEYLQSYGLLLHLPCFLPKERGGGIGLTRYGVI